MLLNLLNIPSVFGLIFRHVFLLFSVRLKVFIFTFTLSVSLVKAQTNLIFNSSFELGMSGYSLNRIQYIANSETLESIPGEIEKSAGVPHGEYCLKIPNPNADIVRFMINEVQLKPNTSYSISMYIKAEKAEFPIRLYAMFSGNTSRARNSNNFTIGTQWQQISFTFTVPAEYDNAHFLVYFPRDRSTSGAIWLDAISLYEGSPGPYTPGEIHEAGFSISNRPYTFYHPSDMVPANVTIYNSGSAGVTALLNCKLTDYYTNETIMQYAGNEVVLSANSSKTVDLPVTAPRNGTFGLEGTMLIAGNIYEISPVYFTAISPEIIPAVVSPEEFSIGICHIPQAIDLEPKIDNPAYYSRNGLEWDEMFSLFSRAGIRWVRDGRDILNWNVICRNGKGTYDFSLPDKMVELSLKNNLSYLPVLTQWGVLYPGYENTWLLQESTIVDPIKESLLSKNVKLAYMPIPTLVEFVTQATSRYKGKITHYEIYNEPNHWFLDPGLYVDHIQAAYSAAKSADPDAQILNFCLSSIKGDIEFAEAAISGGALNYGDDIFSFHPYRHPFERPYVPAEPGEEPIPGDDEFLNTDDSAAGGIAELRGMLAKHDHGDLILWNTELFWQDPERGIDRATPSGIIQRSVIDLGEGVKKTIGIEQTSLFLSPDPSAPSLISQHNVSNVSYWGPNIVAFNTAARFCTGATPIKKIIPHTNVVIYTFENKERILACIWNVGGGSLKGNFTFNATSANFYDLFGNQVSLPGNENISLTINHEPYFIEWTEGNAQQFISALESTTFTKAAVKITVNIPKDYPDILSAINGERVKLSSDDELIITIDEGIYEQQAAATLNWQKKAKINIIGSGAGKTILKSNLSTNPNGFRMFFITDASMANSEISFKDLSIKNYGMTTTDGNGGVIHVGPNLGSFTGKFTNVVFDSNYSINLLNGATTGISWIIDNCLFINNTVSYATNNNTEKAGLISVRRGGNLTMRNTTFISNNNVEYNEVAGIRGSLIWFYGTANTSNNIILENNVFVNTISTDPNLTNVSSAITFEIDANVSSFNLTMNKNICIVNRRDGFTNDIDLLLTNPQKISFVESGSNIFNSVLTRTGGSAPYSYENYNFSGASVSTDYTYIHPEIDFLMDGSLPKLLEDGYGVGYLEYSGNRGTGIIFNNPPSPTLKAFTFQNILRVEGIAEGDILEIFTIAGSLYSKVSVNSDYHEMEIPKGFYILRVGDRTAKVVSY